MPEQLINWGTQPPPQSGGSTPGAGTVRHLPTYGGGVLTHSGGRPVLDRGVRVSSDRTQNYGAVAGFGQGSLARSDQEWYLNNLLQEGDQGSSRAGYAFGQVDDATQAAAGMVGQGNDMMNRGQLFTNAALQGGYSVLPEMLSDSQSRASAIQGAGDQASANMQRLGGALLGGYANVSETGQQRILDAARAPQSSVAQAQAQMQLEQANQNTAALAAQTSRGGNAALAQRQALAASAGQQANTANAGAMLRAQEEADLRNSQIAAASTAGQLGLGAMNGAAGASLSAGQSAGQFGLQGAQGAAGVSQAGYGQYQNANLGLGQLGQQSAGLGANVAQFGLGSQLQGGQALAAIGADERDSARGQFAQLGLGQAQLDQQYQQNDQEQRGRRRAERRGAIGSIVGSMLGGGMGGGMGFGG